MIITIFDETGQPMPGAAVYESDGSGNLAGGEWGDNAASDGTVNVPDGLAFVTVSFLGYSTQILSGASLPATVNMVPSTAQLGTVTITGTPTPAKPFPWNIVIISAISLGLLWGLIHIITHPHKVTPGFSRRG